jgi:hypothetical protein
MVMMEYVIGITISVWLHCNVQIYQKQIVILDIIHVYIAIQNVKL